MDTWASRIVDLRSTGLTLAEIGAECGLSPSGVSDIEQGRTSEPRGDAAVKLHEMHKKLCRASTRKRA
jgi:transcriptional regulator with XRE-family HTH domain